MSNTIPKQPFTPKKLFNQLEVSPKMKARVGRALESATSEFQALPTDKQEFKTFIDTFETKIKAEYGKQRLPKTINAALEVAKKDPQQFKAMFASYSIEQALKNSFTKLREKINNVFQENSGNLVGMAKKLFKKSVAAFFRK